MRRSLVAAGLAIACVLASLLNFDGMVGFHDPLAACDPAVPSISCQPLPLPCPFPSWPSATTSDTRCCCTSRSRMFEN